MTCIDFLPNYVVIIVFWVVGERFLAMARYTHRSLLQSPAQLAHVSTISLTNIIPAGFLTVTSYISLGLPSLFVLPCQSTPPFLQIVPENKF